MAMIIEQKYFTPVPEFTIIEQIEKNPFHYGNISLAERVGTTIDNLPPKSPFLVLGNADEIIKKKYQNKINTGNLLRVNPEETLSLQPEAFPLVIGNISFEESKDVLKQIHTLTKPFGDVFLNIYLRNTDNSIDEETIDELLNKHAFFIRGSNFKTDKVGTNARWEVDMLQNPHDLPSYRRKPPSIYHTGSTWDEYYG